MKKPTRAAFYKPLSNFIMLKKEQKDSLVKESSLLEEAKNLEILGPDSLSQITGGINIYIEKNARINHMRIAL